MPGLWRTPLTWAIGMVTDTMMNQHIRDQLSALKNDHMLCCGRLTLTIGTPVTLTDVLAATTIYYTPYIGNLMAVHDGDHWQVLSFPELSLSLSGDAANTNYDVFAYYNAGAIAIERTAWSSATARSIALTRMDGVLVKSSDTTRRYLGTYRTTAVAGQCEDSELRRFCWNYYHRLRRRLVVRDFTSSWTYSVAAWRQVNANAANQVAMVIGVAEAMLVLHAMHVASSTAANALLATSMGDSATTAPSGDSIYSAAHTAVANINVTASSVLSKYPDVGYRYYPWLEVGSATGTLTWLGANYGAHSYEGMTGWIEG